MVVRGQKCSWVGRSMIFSVGRHGRGKTREK